MRSFGLESRWFWSCGLESHWFWPLEVESRWFWPLEMESHSCHLVWRSFSLESVDSDHLVWSPIDSDHLDWSPIDSDHLDLSPVDFDHWVWGPVGCDHLVCSTIFFFKPWLSIHIISYLNGEVHNLMFFYLLSIKLLFQLVELLRFISSLYY